MKRAFAWLALSSVACGPMAPEAQAPQPEANPGAGAEIPGIEPGSLEEPAGSPPGAAPAGVPADMQSLLAAHNDSRAEHCAPPLTWSAELAATAQDWANQLATGCTFEHKPNNRFGENLAGGSPGMLDGRAVTAMWYDEVAKYRFPDGGFSMETGHFTQVVWKGTTQIGCAKATCSMDLWVCEYDAPGNMQGAYRANVLPTSCR